MFTSHVFVMIQINYVWVCVVWNMFWVCCVRIGRTYYMRDACIFHDTLWHDVLYRRAFVLRALYVSNVSENRYHIVFG